MIRTGVPRKLSVVTGEDYRNCHCKCQLKDLMCGLLRKDFCDLIMCIYLLSFLIQHWLEVTKSIAKQIKCKYCEFMFIFVDNLGNWATISFILNKKSDTIYI